mmetsp:Transcript_4182/g.8691  ORF Transcript_4182/g.8691 Transcript_4182/m.8691 type:complete len:415 (+) Transcript_4182:150-1394(+)
MGSCGTRPAAAFPGEGHTKLVASSKSAPSQSLSQNDGPSLLSIFHEDIMLTILSFVADVPFELKDGTRDPIDTHSTLTHVLPHVSKQFHKLCSEHDHYWKNALLRLVKDDPYLWEEGLKRLIFESECNALRESINDRNKARVRRGKRTKTINSQSDELDSVQNTSSDVQGNEPDSRVVLSAGNNPEPSKEEQLVHKGCQALETYPPRHHTASSSGIYQCLYQTILNSHIRFQAPVFYMPTSVQLGSPYGLHFFEPRYRLLISDCMRSFPVSARRGEEIKPCVPGLSPSSNNITTVSQNAEVQSLLENNKDIMKEHYLPTFIHAHQSPLRRNTPACIVQVRHCIIQPDGSADVFLQPVSYIWIEEIWERPGTGSLYEARGIRMPKDESEKYEMWCVMSRYGRGDGRGWAQMLPIP